MKMITAKQAREISGPSSKDYLLFIEGKIKSAAESKGKSVTIRDEPYARWLYSEKENTQAAKEAIKCLRENGFQLKLYYKEMQFVDMGLEISW